MLQPDLQSETEVTAQAALASIGAWEAREARRIVRGVCIDSDHSLDRDDAIWFEETADGKLIVDITIADVASFVSKGSLLDQRARKLVETEYGADTVIEPMFPFRLSQDDGNEGNGVFSLSDKSIRAGVTTRIVLNLQTKRMEHVETFPSLIHPEIRNYKQIAEAIAQNPTGRFAKWATYTKQLKEIRQHSGESVIPIHLSDDLGEHTTHINEEGVIEEFTAGEGIASKMVEETALLSNRANARFFAACNLPYLFRIHQIKLEGDALEGPHQRGYETLDEAQDARRALMETHQTDITMVLDRAQYSARRRPHAALAEYAYGHNTSPIRRYADIPNQRMQHWLYETCAELAHLVHEALPEIAPDKLIHYLGHLRENPETQQPLSGTKLVGWVGRLRMGEREAIRKHCRAKLLKYLTASLRELSPYTSISELHQHAKMIIQQLDSRIKPPPYTYAEMEQIAQEINLHRSQQHLSERERLAQNLMLSHVEQQLEIAELQVLTALEMSNHQARSDAMAEFSAEKRFPLTLHIAAQQSKEYRIPASEILKRMQEGRLREPSDLATVLVQTKVPKCEDAAEDPAFDDEASQKWLKQNVEDWKRLKEIFLSRFEANPSFTKGFLKYLETRYAWEIHSTHASLIAEGAIAATMSLNPKPNASPEVAVKETLFPPYFSIGHWGKTTRHHARLQLLKGLAYDELQPADKVKLPRALRLMTAAGFSDYLGEDSTVIDLLADKADKTGITIQSNWNKEVETYYLHAQTKDVQRDPITFIGQAKDKTIAKIFAWQALLRSKLMRPVHEELFRKREQLEAIPIDADDAMIWLDEQSDVIRHQLKLSSTNQYTQRREPIWRAMVKLKLGRALNRQFEGESTQADVACTFANEGALRYLRERADYGDRAIIESLKTYEKEVINRYAQGNQLSSQVPYSAKMNGREILLVGTSNDMLK